MKKIKILFMISALTVISPVAFVALDKGIVVKISDPSGAGTEVHQTYMVQGIASIPSGTHLWVLARRENFEGVWWPQGEGKVDPVTRKWQVSVTFGTEKDIGWSFDIAAVIVSEDSHIKLRDYRINAMKSGEWRPIEMPKVLTAPVLRKVKKIGD